MARGVVAACREPRTTCTSLITIAWHRVQYVYVQNSKSQGYEKAESAEYACEHNMPLDLVHYLEHQVSAQERGMCRPL